jgi:hypothetical protein
MSSELPTVQVNIILKPNEVGHYQSPAVLYKPYKYNYPGRIIITNKRIVFVSNCHRRTLTYQLSKLLNYIIKPAPPEDDVNGYKLEFIKENQKNIEPLYVGEKQAKEIKTVLDALFSN